MQNNNLSHNSRNICELSNNKYDADFSCCWLHFAKIQFYVRNLNEFFLRNMWQAILKSLSKTREWKLSRVRSFFTSSPKTIFGAFSPHQTKDIDCVVPLILDLMDLRKRRCLNFTLKSFMWDCVLSSKVFQTTDIWRTRKGELEPTEINRLRSK